MNFVIQGVIALAAAYLTAPNLPGPVKNKRKSPLVERGSPTPVVLGRDEVGQMQLWRGNRSTEKESLGGGKGLFGDEQETYIYYEEGWHGLCIGPAYRLWSIRQNGKIIFNGPIDRASHPSGTSINLGKSRFTIYWGEDHQPVNTSLSAAKKLTIASRWPYLCYVHWNTKRLGGAPLWPRMTYDIEVWPHTSKIVTTPAWFEPTATLTGNPFEIETVQSGPRGVNYVDVQTISAALKPGMKVRIEGQPSVQDGDYTILKVDKFKQNKTEYHDTQGPGKYAYRRVYFTTSMILSPGQGTLEAYTVGKDDGMNAAHGIYQILFAPYPHGLNLDVTKYDIDSLEALGLLMQQENIRTTISTTDFPTFRAKLGEMLQDLGFFLSWNAKTRKWQFRTIREDSEFAEIPERIIVEQEEEREVIQIDPSLITRRMYSFKDRARDYVEVGIHIDDDGQASIDKVFNATEIPLPTVRDFVSGQSIALRRDAEENAFAELATLKASREARLIVPGMQLVLPGEDEIKLVTKVHREDSESDAVKLSVVPNYYGVTPSSVVIDDGIGQTDDTLEDASEDFAVIPFEVPASINGTGQVQIAVARIRSGGTVLGGDVYLSSDDIGYTLVGSEDGVHTGGFLNADVPVDGPMLIDVGPTFTAVGPDIEHVLDLSAAENLQQWQRGRQIAVVGTSEGCEFWFVRWVEALGGDQYRMRGVIRGRFDAPAIAHVTDTPVIIFDEGQINKFADLLLTPGDTAYVKVLPQNTDVGLDELTVYEMAGDPS